MGTSPSPTPTARRPTGDDRASSAIVVAAATVFAELRASRGARLLAIGGLAVSALTVAATVMGGLTKGDVLELREFLIVPGLPIAALVAAEVPVREGLRGRTLLHALLGPVPKRTLVVVRTVVVALALAVFWSALLTVAGLVGGIDATLLLRGCAGALLGSFAYMGIWGVLHVVTARGIFAGLAAALLFDWPLSQVPVGLRNIAPSSHVANVSDAIVTSTDGILVLLASSPAAVTTSVAVLVFLGALGTWGAAEIVSRRDLVEVT